MPDTQRRIRLATMLVLLSASGAALAENTAVIDTGIGFSDNITRSSTDEIDETLASIGLRVGMERDEGRLTGLFNADVEYISYLDDTYDDDVYGRVDLSGDYAFVPDLFSWHLDESWGQVRRDPFAVYNPANVENSNYFATGPDFSFMFGSRTFMTVTARWSDTTYEKSQRDYNRLGAGVALGRSISERSSVAFHAYAARVEFDNPAFGSDYDAQEYFGRYTAEGAKTRLELDAGYTEIHDYGDSNGSPLFRLSVSRDVTARSVLTFNVGTEYSDSGQVFQESGEGSGGLGGASDVISTGDPFERRYFELGWSTIGERSRLGIGVNYRQELYESLTALDRDVTEVYVDYGRSLTEAMHLSLGARYEMEEYDDGSYDDDRLELRAGLDWDLSRKVFIGADYELYKGDSNSPLREYDENRAWLRFGYRLR